jgi:hypothetical protein
MHQLVKKKICNLFICDSPEIRVGGSCEIVALRENFIDKPESYDSYSAKSCIFLFNFSLIICHIRDLIVWSRGKGKTNFVRLVMVRE